MQKEKFIFLFFVFVVFLLFFLKSYFFVDPDFGWHFKLGELILQSGIPKADPFSYTMPSYPFVDHEWLSNVFIYLVYIKLGWLSLAALYSIIPILAILLQVLRKQAKNRIILLALPSFSLILFAGIRTQMISLLFLSVLITIFENKNIYKRFKYFIPLLFLLWVNLHGGFAIGIAIFILYLGIKIFREKKVSLADSALLLVSFLITFVNPYGWRIWWEVWMQITDSSLRFTIAEWSPGVFWFLPQIWIYVIISLTFFLKYKKKLDLTSMVLYALLLAAGLSSVRHITLWIIAAIPLTSDGFFYFEKSLMGAGDANNRLSKAKNFVIGFCIFSFIFTSLLIINKQLNYPESAISFLKQNPSSGQLFSSHAWGGYLIWRYPQKKVFVDGRMNSWRRSTAPVKESKYAFNEYLDVYSGKKDINEVVNKYEIDTFLLPAVGLRKQSLVKNTKYGSIYDQLKKNKWKIVYQDKTALVYMR